MSGLWNMGRRMWGFAPEGQGEKGGARRRLGRNDDPYYGPTLDALHKTKHGTQKVSQALAAQGGVVKQGRYVALGGEVNRHKVSKASRSLLGG